MTNFKTSFFAGVFVALAACGSGGGDNAKFEALLTTLDGFKTQMCACTDKACADKVNTEYRAHMASPKGIEKGDKPSEAQDKKGKAITEALRACRDKHGA